jgi:hypothetical protein
MADAGARRIHRPVRIFSRGAASRRALLRGLGALLAIGAAAPGLAIGAAAPGHASTTPDRFPDGSTLLVGGPADGMLSGWGARLAAALLDGQPAGAVLHRHAAGGADGVTAANQFEARVVPDGQTALLAPGAAALAWLAGDPRAHYDVAKWLPIMAGVTPGMVCGREAAITLPVGARLRVAAGTVAGPELPALLAAELLGLAPVPVLGMQDPAAARRALAEGRADVVFVRGPDSAAELAALREIGVAPLFGMGCADEAGVNRRDPLMPDLPTLSETAVSLRGRPPSGPLHTAWQACAGAADLEFALVLPVLAPAAMVSLWRKAARRLAAAPHLQAASERLLAAPGANAVLAAVAADAPVLLALRHWMTARLGWRPG